MGLPATVPRGCATASRATCSIGADLERIERGYYERLIAAGRRLDDLGDVPGLRIRSRSGATWSVPVEDAPLIVRVNDLREVVLSPDDVEVKGGVSWRTNAQGMRDRSYCAREARRDLSHRTCRRFHRRRLGRRCRGTVRIDPGGDLERARESASGPTVEILNCAVPGHAPGQRWDHFSRIGWPMRPDLVICESTAADVGWDERRLRFLLARGLGWDSPIYQQALVSVRG